MFKSFDYFLVLGEVRWFRVWKRRIQDQLVVQFKGRDTHSCLLMFVFTLRGPQKSINSFITLKKLDYVIKFTYDTLYYFLTDVWPISALVISIFHCVKTCSINIHITYKIIIKYFLIWWHQTQIRIYKISIFLSCYLLVLNLLLSSTLTLK